MAFWQWLLNGQRANRLTRGQGLVEYALILVLVAIVTIIILVLLGPTIYNVFDKVLQRM